ncbi:MAG: hypothetical protein IJ874_09360 [Ruminococcus sp.]|nr:hypothetical protein [Ruminococcus sp.]
MGLFDKLQEKVKTLQSDLLKKAVEKPRTSCTPVNGLISADGALIPFDAITSPYYLPSLVSIGGCDYLFDPQNKKMALANITILNNFISEARKLVVDVSSRRFSEKQFEEQQVTSKSNKDYKYYPLYLEVCALTATKREIAKYPYFVCYRPDDETFASVYYTKSGAIGKIEITTWKKQRYCHEIHITEISGMLTVKAIYKTDLKDFKKHKVYFNS